MILVTGATGSVGRPLVDTLSRAQTAVRVVTRHPETATFPAGVEVTAADPSQPETLLEALRGVTALFLHPRAVGLAAPNLLKYAADLGTRRVVALTAINIDDPPDEQPSRFRGDRNKEVEAAAIDSGLDWVSLRSASFARNAIDAWAPQIRQGDVVRGPYANFAEAAIDERDVAEVAAQALLRDDLLNERLELTGPESLTNAEMVHQLGRALRRPLQYQEVPPQVARDVMVRQGIPAPFVAALMNRYARTAGRPARVTDHVAVALRRPARTFAEWAADHAAAFQH